MAAVPDPSGGGMRKWFSRIRDQVDNYLALTLAVVFSVLGLLNLSDAEVMGNAMLATLAVLAFSMIRDRARRNEEREAEGAALRETADRLGKGLVTLRRLEEAVTRFDDVRGALAGVAELEVVTGERAIAAAFEAAREHTDFWEFKGGTGTYLRARTLPELAMRARRRNQPIKVRVDILDPSDIGVCSGYAAFNAAHELSSPGGEPWDVRLVRLNCYATVLAACWYWRHSPLEVELGLSSTWSSQRFDVSATCMLTTVCGNGWPAYRLPAEGRLHADYRTALAVAFRQARTLPIKDAAGVPLALSPAPDEVPGLFARLGLDLDPAFGGDEVKRIVHLAVSARNPYDD
ncbi:hypothetical protein [Bailinhaonella thermotolerans]|uniref:Uncharacterized protein n=1 Tax=Bailinhaonella thermotolerans TaxID=1070861 RepID=A0A3A4B6Z9_9ACTN|nr:hypothetical protein [Bailinhaonella thermotolerans]RJL34347.1 hypothetical protein D5H75_07850 [Bailinhaonella thermotolerans]